MRPTHSNLQRAAKAALEKSPHTPCSLHPHANVPRPCPSTTSIFNSRHWTLPAIDPALPPCYIPPPIDPRLPLSSLFLPLMIPLLLSILHGILICIFSRITVAQYEWGGDFCFKWRKFRKRGMGSRSKIANDSWKLETPLLKCGL